MQNKHSYKKNDNITVEINNLTDLGFGVGRVCGVVIFVADTVPGDFVEAKIIKVNSSYLVGRVTKFIEKSDKRVTDRCDNEGCKSCAYRHISYAEELSLKEEGVRRLFSAPELSGVSVSSIISSPKEMRYRNKAQYPVCYKDGEYSVGFFAPKSHRVTPVRDCPLTPAVFSEICECLLSLFSEIMPTVYDEESGEGLVRHIYLRRGEVSGEVLLTIVINGRAFPDADRLVKTVTERFPEVVGILLNVNEENTNVVLGDEYISLFGRDYIYDALCGVRLKITAPSFYQVNHDGAEVLYNKARELAKPKKTDTLLDLYCGAGSIGLSMASEVKELFGIEIIDSAVLCARENAKANGIDNAHFFTGDAANTERFLDRAEAELGRKIEPDIVILDPPRAGCDEGLIRFISSLSPSRIVYISCNPKTLARDVKLFFELGYICNEVTPVDMFPMTGHVECVVCLTRKEQ